MSTLRQKWNDFLFTPASASNLGVLRFLFFTVGSTFFFFKREIHVPTFFDHWLPISYYRLLPGPIPPNILHGFEFTWLALTWLAGWGFGFRWLAPVGTLCGMIFLGHEYCFGQVYHSRHLYIGCALILSFSRAGDAFVFWKESAAGQSPDYRWPVRWVQLYVVYVMFLTGLEKLYYGGPIQWAFSDSFYLRLFVCPDKSFFNRWVVEQPLVVSQLLAFFALYVVEVSAPLAFLNRRIGYLYVAFWSSFHVLVTLTLGNHFLFYSQILGYLSFIDWQKHFGPRTELTTRGTMTAGRKRILTALIAIFFSISVFQVIGGRREDYPFTWYGMFNGNVSSRDVFRYALTLEQDGKESVNLFAKGNGWNLLEQFDRTLRGWKTDFNNTVLQEPGPMNLSPENLALTARIVNEAAGQILDRLGVPPSPEGKIKLRYEYWQEFRWESRHRPDEAKTILEIPDPRNP